MGGEGDVPGCRHDDVGHDAALETAHPVGEHDAGHAAERSRSTRRAAPASSPGSRRPRTARSASGSRPARRRRRGGRPPAPVDDEVLARDRQPGPIGRGVAAIGGLGLRRPRGAGCAPSPRSRRPEQSGSRRLALIRPSVASTRSAISSASGSVALGRGGRSTGGAGAALHDPADGLVGRPAERGGSPIAAELAVRGQDVQLFPR